MSAFWSGHAGAHRRMLLDSAAVRVVCALWSGHACSAAAGCCCQSAGAGVAAGGGCKMSMAVWVPGHDGDYVYAVAKKTRAPGCHHVFSLLGLYAGVILSMLSMVHGESGESIANTLRFGGILPAFGVAMSKIWNQQLHAIGFAMEHHPCTKEIHGESVQSNIRRTADLAVWESHVLNFDQNCIWMFQHVLATATYVQIPGSSFAARCFHGAFDSIRV